MEVFNLKNNIKVLFNKTDGVKVVSVKVYTPVSVISENPQNAGISHMTARLMVKSTKNRSREILANDIDDIGANLHPDGDYDYIGFNMDFLSEYFDKAAEILSDIAVNPAFDEKDISDEKRDTAAAFKSRKDAIFHTALDKFIKLFYADAPYSNPVMGKPETVEALTSEDLKGWHKFSYNASNILISVSGNVESKIVKESLEKYFGNIESGQKFEKQSFSSDIKRPSKTVEEGKFNQAYIFTGFDAPPLSGKDFVALKVASAVLGGRMTSRLFVELREKLGLAYETSAVYPSRLETSFFAVYIGLDKKNIDLTLNKIDEILKDFRSVQISEQELKDVKTYIKGMYIMDRQTVSRTSYYYAWREVTGQGYKYDDQYLDDVEKVTPKDVYNAANKFFTQKRLTVIIKPK
ncbi:MAG: insulinase family protein [Endomicrobium sp.]|nr:insulinase family protein [Endomicrobium sp.]